MSGSSLASSRPTILLIDDESVVLTLLRAVLEGRGFEVHTASSGEEGIDLYRRHHDTLALVLLDICMPGLDGPHTLTELRRINPRIQACFMSGNTGDYSPEALQTLGMVRFFSKPFSVLKLADELWELVNGNAAQPAESVG